MFPPLRFLLTGHSPNRYLSSTCRVPGRKGWQGRGPCPCHAASAQMRFPAVDSAGEGGSPEPAVAAACRREQRQEIVTTWCHGQSTQAEVLGVTQTHSPSADAGFAPTSGARVFCEARSPVSLLGPQGPSRGA